MSIAVAFKKNFQKFPHKIAIELNNKSVTFQDINIITNRISNSLKNLGVKKGDRIAQYVPNSLELIYTTVSSFKVGAIVVPMNTAFKEREIAFFLQDSEPKVIVTDTERLSILENVLSEVPSLEYILVIDLKEPSGKYIDFHELMSNRYDGDPEVEIDDEDGAIIFYTSGTTGRPKGALLAQRSITSNLEALQKAWEWTSEDLFILTLPMFHIHGLGVGLCGSLYTGCSTIVKSKFDAKDVLSTIQNMRVTLFMGVPTMYFRILEVEGCEEFDVSSMRLFVSGSAPLSKDLFTKFHKTFGHKILERAGMSESMMNYSNPYHGDRRPGTVGFPLPGVEIRIVDENFNDVPANTEGEIVIKGPNLLKGYWGNEEATAKAFKDGWFKTGDICKRDQDGYISIVGRSKDIIISGGVNLYPREIEEVIESIPAVKEAAVVGIPDEEFGEAVKACIVLEKDAEVTEEEIIAYCKERLASFKKPKRVEFLDTLPKNAMGKIMKDKLK